MPRGQNKETQEKAKYNTELRIKLDVLRVRWVAYQVNNKYISNEFVENTTVCPVLKVSYSSHKNSLQIQFDSLPSSVLSDLGIDTLMVT